MDRFAPSKSDGRALGYWIALTCAALAGCGDASCPAGSTSINGRCEPAPSCRADEELVDGECVDEMSIMQGDGGLDSGQLDNQDGGEVAADGAVADDGSVIDQDSAVEESDDPLCASVECGDHGACQVRLGAPVCICSDGFDGDACDVCREDLVLDGDVCVAPCDASDAPWCSEYGTCEVLEGEPTCVCEHPYSGETCEECAEGFALQDDGTCEPDCGDCGVHGFCNEGLMTPVCECFAGYADDGGSCEWVGDGVTGGIEDGELEDGAAWTLTHATMVGGEVTFQNFGSGASCSIGSLEQVFTMPSLDEAEPMMVEVDISSACDAGTADQCPSLLLELGDGVTRLPVQAGSTSQTLRACLGDEGYGGEVRMRILPSILGPASASASTVFSCADDAWPSVEAVRIVPAADTVCAPQAWIANGSFSSTQGWTLTNATISGGSLNLNASGRATTNIVVPSSAQIASPALRVHYLDGVNVTLAIDGSLPMGGLFAADNTAGAQTVCLPDWARGTGHTLTLTSSSTAISELEIVDDSRCGDGAFDRGFERSSSGAVASQGSWSSNNGFPIVTTSAAYQGSNGLRMNQAVNLIAGLARVPFARSASGPAFQTWHRSTTASLDVSARLTPALAAAFPLESNLWQRRVDCLPRAYEGQLVLFYVIAQLTNGPAELHLDEVGPILHSSCD